MGGFTLFAILYPYRATLLMFTWGRICFFPPPNNEVIVDSPDFTLQRPTFYSFLGNNAMFAGNGSRSKVEKEELKRHYALLSMDMRCLGL
ncbi:hypothetical protein Ddc_00497 [Ditylenchus destructor]|nr:hypothetical protein Ddc_00497 [Ditylenchus destructor]